MNKKDALILAKQSGAAYELSAAKGGLSVSNRTKEKYKRRNKIKGKNHGKPVAKSTEEKNKKEPYEPGTLGLSEVSTKIRQDNGAVFSRRDRRSILRLYTAYYNGDGPIRVKHNIKPSKYSKGRKKAHG